jgi:hypothetical protein
MSLLLQGASLAGIALHYDQGFLTAETTTGATLVNRRVMRDAALQKLDSAIGLADTAVFTTPASWTNGTSYSSQSVARIGRTMAALLLANWPRNPTENAAVDWGRVASYAQRGMSEGTPLDFRFTADGCNRWCPEVTSWFNDPTTGRVHTRVSALLDPSQIDPWPIGGNPRPNSADRRLGDGSYGTVEDSVQFWTVPRTASAGTDFAYSSESPFNPSRGSYHQSNIAHIRYALPGTSFGTPVGTIPAMSATQNDLVWAEALVRSGGSAALAATLINRSRVGRGGLPAAAAGEGSEALLAHWSYESELELLGLSSAPFLFRRRTASLVTGTPLEMPVPVRVLNTLGLGTYTWGGAVVSSPTPP